MKLENKSTKNFAPVPAGMHLARCYRFIDLGTQQTEFEGQVKHLRKIKVSWEVHSEDDNGIKTLTDKGEPMVVSKDYTRSWNEKATLRKDLQTWRGRPFTETEQSVFELKHILGTWCMLNILHRPKKTGEGVYANVVSITPVPAAVKNLGLPDGFNETSSFNLDDPDMAVFATLPDWMQEVIKKSPEWKYAAQGGQDDDIQDNSAPF